MNKFKQCIKCYKIKWIYQYTLIVNPKNNKSVVSDICYICFHNERDY